MVLIGAGMLGVDAIRRRRLGRAESLAAAPPFASKQLTAYRATFTRPRGLTTGVDRAVQLAEVGARWAPPRRNKKPPDVGAWGFKEWQ